MKRYFKIFGVAFLSGVGAARVLVWLNASIAHLLVMRGGWDMAEAVKAAPWILFALGLGLILSVGGMLAESEYYKDSAEKQQEYAAKAPTKRKAG